MKPRIFIGSSVKSLYIANALNANLDHDAQCTVWDTAFPASQITIDSLIEQSSDKDFGIFVFSDDDIISSGNQQYNVTRPNVIFESGLFMGNLGKDRVFIVTPRDIDDFYKLTDLAGFTTLTYDSKRAKQKADTKAALKAVADGIVQAIDNSIWSKLKLDIAAISLYNPAPKITFPLKLEFKITNNSHFPITIESLNFNLDSSLKFASNSSARQHKPLFLSIAGNGTHEYYEQIAIDKGKQAVSCWVPIDHSIKSALDLAVKNKKTGVWKYRCTLLKEHVITCTYEVQF